MTDRIELADGFDDLLGKLKAAGVIPERAKLPVRIEINDVRADISYEVKTEPQSHPRPSDGHFCPECEWNQGRSRDFRSEGDLVEHRYRAHYAPLLNIP